MSLRDGEVGRVVRWGVEEVAVMGREGDPPLLVAGDVEAFCFIFFNNFLNMSIAYSLLVEVLAFEPLFVQSHVIPGMGISVMVGSLFYWWQARRLSRAEGRHDVCALPYGVAAPSLFAFVSLILLPEYLNVDRDAAYSASIFASFWSGVIEALTAFYGGVVRRHVPHAALLASLTGIAIALIATGTLYQVFARPALAMIPFLFFIFSQAARVDFKMTLGGRKFALPWGLVNIAMGTAIGWLIYAFNPSYLKFASGGWSSVGFYYPIPAFDHLARGFGNGFQFASVIAPLAIINGVGSLQTLASAEGQGDKFSTFSSLIVNGVSGSISSLFGAPFPTTLYIGHPTCKAMGARSGYMLLNGLAIMLVSTLGLVQFFLTWMPIETILPILIWIGFSMTVEGVNANDATSKAEALQPIGRIPSRHLLAIAVGVTPAFAGLTVEAVLQTVTVTGTHLSDIISKFEEHGFYLEGAIALYQGFLLSSMFLAATVVFWIDRKFLHAAVCLACLSVLSMVGIIHAFKVTDRGVENKFMSFTKTGFIAHVGFAITYAGFSALMIVLHVLQQWVKFWGTGKLERREERWVWNYDNIDNADDYEEVAWKDQTA